MLKNANHAHSKDSTEPCKMICLGGSKHGEMFYRLKQQHFSTGQLVKSTRNSHIMLDDKQEEKYANVLNLMWVETGLQHAYDVQTLLDLAVEMLNKKANYEGRSIEEYSDRVSKLKQIKEVQSSEGNYDYSEYMRGMANGLILASSIMEGTEPNYKESAESVKGTSQ